MPQTMQPIPTARRSARCFLTAEVLAAMSLTAGLVLLTSVATIRYVSARREADTRRELRSIAAAELQRLRAGLLALEPSERVLPTDRPSAVRVTVTTKLGEGPWNGLTHVRVRASRAISDRRTIEVELAAYVAAGASSP